MSFEFSTEFQKFLNSFHAKSLESISSEFRSRAGATEQWNSMCLNPRPSQRADFIGRVLFIVWSWFLDVEILDLSADREATQKAIFCLLLSFEKISSAW